MDIQVNQGPESLEIILQSISEPVLVQDRELRCIYANDLAVQMLGFQSVTQFKYKSLPSALNQFQLLTEDGKSYSSEHSAAYRVLTGANSAESIFQIRNPRDGSFRWVRSTARPIRSSEALPFYIVTVLRDITADYKPEWNIKFISKVSGGVLESSKIGLWEWNFQNNELFLSNMSQQILGLSTSNLCESYEEFLDLVHPGDLTYVLHSFTQARKVGKESVFEFRLIRQNDKAEIWVQVQGKICAGENSFEESRMIGTIIDITRPKNNEEMRRKMEQKVAKLQTISAYLSKAVTPVEIAQVIINEGLRAVDAEAGSVYIKDELTNELKRLYSQGYNSEVLAQWSKITMDDSIPLVDAVKTAYPVILESKSEMERLYPHIAEQIKNTRTQCWVAVPLVVQNQCFGAIGFSFSKNRLRAGQVDYIQSLADHAAQALDRARIYQKAEEERIRAHFANQAKSLFLANMSHEIRTPMNAILGFSKLLRERNLSEFEKEELIRRIEANGDHLLHLIDDILDLSRVEAGQMKVEKKSFSLQEMLWDVEESLKMLVVSKNIQVEMISDPLVPNRIQTDPVRLKQVLMNLVGNSAKFTHSGYIRIYVKANAENKLLSFEIEDTGIGIADSVQSQLFKPFSQGDDSITRRFGGTGLGLVLSRRISEAIGGKLELVWSRKGKGTLFRVTIPWLKAEAPTQLKTVKVPEPIFSQEKKVLKVLLAEDVYDNQLLIDLYLKNSNIQLTLANNGLEAVQKASEAEFDLILMDIQMPRMDGLEATRQIRAKGYKGPILALTAHALPEEIKNSMNAGCSGHLTKPISKSVLLQQIRNLTAQHSVF